MLFHSVRYSRQKPTAMIKWRHTFYWHEYFQLTHCTSNHASSWQETIRENGYLALSSHFQQKLAVIKVVSFHKKKGKKRDTYISKNFLSYVIIYVQFLETFLFDISIFFRSWYRYCMSFWRSCQMKIFAFLVGVNVNTYICIHEDDWQMIWNMKAKVWRYWGK